MTSILSRLDPRDTPSTERPRSLIDPTTDTRWIRASRVTAAVFAVAVVVVGAVRFSVMASGDAPPTIDSGNWLSFADSLLGNSPRAGSITYPPVVPLLTELFTTLFGLRDGIAVLAAVSSVAPAIGLYAALRMARVGPLRVVPALLLLGAGSIGEAAAWGGFPQLIAMAVLPITLVLGLDYLENPTARTSLKLGVSTLILLATSHFVSVIAVTSFAVILVIDTVARRQFAMGRPHFKWLPLVIGPSLPLAIIYIKLIDAVFLHPNEFASLDNLTWGTVLQRLDLVYSELPVLWQILIPLAMVTPALTWSIRRCPAWRLSTSLLIAVLLLLLVTHEGRYLYIAPLFSVTALAVWSIELSRGIDISKITWPGRAAYGLLGLVALLAVVLQLQAGLGRFNDQRDFYAVLNSGLVDAIEVSDTAIETAGGAIAIPSLNDAPIGWWVEALTNERVIYGSPLRWLNFSDEVERATAANAIFHPLFPDSASLDGLQSADVRVVIIPRQWAWYDEVAVDMWISDNDLDVIERNADALAIDVGR